MKLTLPSSRNKHYLSGIDWMIHALDHASRKQLECGTAFQIVMELSSALNSADLEKYLSDYCACFPHLNGKLSRDWNLAPYWKLQPPNNLFKLKSISALNTEEAYRNLETELNQPAARDAFPLRGTYIETPQKNLFGLIFDHRLFDARGAERFLQDFQNFYLARGNVPVMKLPPAPAHLDHWSEKFAAGKKINRARIASQKTRAANVRIRFLDQPRALKGRLNRFKIKTFDEAETQAIFDSAGPFMFLPYSLAMSIQSMRAFFLEREGNAGDLAVSVTHDMRSSQGHALSETFFNHLSFIFFQVKNDETEKFDVLLQSLKSQFYEQVKNKMPEALADASMLMRILPLSGLSHVLQTRQYNPVAFSFASLSNSAYRYEKFMDSDVEKLFHMPRIPPLPGIGIFFSQYKKRLNVTLSYLDHLITEHEAQRILNALSHR